MPLDDVGLKTLAIELAAAMPPPAYEQVTSSLPYVETTARARAIRSIEWIALQRGWKSEVIRTLDRAGAPHVDLLDDSEVFALRDRMERYEDCLQYGCDPADAPPAL